ncbi:uncharacterized protein [Paramisgurnus dabryanus]|uniref:uncharacterized protein n=1 Tax=Paramisgurnus dabryanus TaxID=90735 RepID=UPI0031F3CFE9
MKSVFISLLLVSWLTLETCQDMTDAYYDIEYITADYDYVPVTRVPVPPNITVYHQVDDREHVIVMCTFESGIHWFGWSSCELSVKTEHNYTLDKIRNRDDVNLFVVTVNPPVSFTCMCMTTFNENITYSEAYIFDQSGNLNIQVRKGSDHHGEGVSLVYIGFVSFITLGLIIMIAAVILTTIKSNTKGASPNITVINNDYEDA